ncbi:putative dinucleotide-binding enzyme [Bradyrhizobium sp. USDA 377]
MNCAIILGSGAIGTALARRFVAKGIDVALANDASQILGLLDKRVQRFDGGLPILHREKQADRMR